MRELLFLAFVATGFGLGAQQLQQDLSAFAIVHLALAALAFVAATALGLRKAAADAPSVSDGEATSLANGASDAVLGVVATAGFAWLAMGAADLSGLRADLTFERRYELADATVAELERLGPGLRLTLYYDPGDPRIRRSRLLLDHMAEVSGATVDQRELTDDLEDIDRFGVGSSNTVVLVRTDAPPTQRYNWELVDRPSEGTLFEALARLADPIRVRIYAFVGTGEGDFNDSDAAGFSGLSAALATEGYELIPLPSAFVSEIPPDATAVLTVAPERALATSALSALRTYLNDGGRWISLLEPGRTSGLEELLAEYGLRSPDALVVDPASADVGGAAPGLSPIAFNYADHPVARGLNRNRVTFFQGARSFELRKPDRSDRLHAVVTSTGDAWLTEEPGVLRATRTPLRPVEARTNFQPLVVTGQYARNAKRPTRIVAFGDSDFASNRYLRSLYNLDLFMNAVHWAVERENAITLRPKIGSTVQFPVPLQNSLNAFYGVGMLIPELLLVAGGLVWLRRLGA